MESPTTSLWCSEEAARLYTKQAMLYIPTAVSWILEYYQQTHPDWRPGISRIPLVVDVGCGTGHLSAPLAEHCERLIGVDLSPQQVKVAREVSARPNVEYKVASAMELSAHCPAGEVDLIVVGMAAHYLDTDEFYSEIRRCLRPGGVLVMVSFWYPGIRHENPEMATVFSRSARKVSTTEKYLDLLDSFYRDLYCPLVDATRREIELHPDLSRKEVRELFATVKCLYKNGEESVNAIMDALPLQEKYSLIFKVFGIFCRF